MKNVPLGDVIEVQSGFAFKSAEYTENGYFLIRIGNVQSGELTSSNPKYVSLDEKTARFALRNGDILTSLTGNIGRVALVEEQHLPAALNQRVARLTSASASLDSRYLYQFCSSRLFRDALIGGGHGAAQQNVSPKQIKEIPIPLPSLAEQRRIVVILEEALAGIAAATAKAEKNLANAREIYASILEKHFLELEAQATGLSLGEFCDVAYGYTAKANIHPVGPKFLRITDIQEGRVDWNAVPYCDIDSNEKLKYQLCAGDIVFARTGATTGKSFLLTEPPDSVCASYLIRLRVKNEDVSPDFVQLFFQTQRYWETVNAGMSGSAQGGFNASKLKEMVIPIPDEAAQTEVIEAARSAAYIRDKLVQNYEYKLEALTELRAAILRQAFTGNLDAEQQADAA